MPNFKVKIMPGSKFLADVASLVEADASQVIQIIFYRNKKKSSFKLIFNSCYTISI